MMLFAQKEERRPIMVVVFSCIIILGNCLAKQAKKLNMTRRQEMPIYNKLVRDRIPEIIKEQGNTLSTRILENEEYLNELRTKLQEETNEYLEAESSAEAIEELADIMELLYALAEVYGVTSEMLEQIRAEKAEKRGGFKERVYLIEVEDAY